MTRPLVVSTFLMVPVTLTIWGCSGSPTQATAASTVTATFTGTLNQQGSNVYPFSVSQAGDVTATLTSVGPLTTLAIGFGIGSYDSSTSTCALLTEDDNARQGDVLGGAAQPGSYCVEVFDVGNVQTSATYSVQVVHP
jgi:hypothetical protein